MKHCRPLSGFLFALTLTALCIMHSFAQEKTVSSSGSASADKTTMTSADKPATATATVVITTRSGDRLSGKFIAVTSEKLEIENAWGGRLTIRTDEITEWQTADDKLRAQLTTATAQKKTDPRFIVNAKTDSASRPAIKSADPSKDSSKNVSGNGQKSTAAKPVTEKADPWKRSVDFAYSMTRGNVSARDLNGAFSISRKVGSKRFAFNSLGRNGARNGRQTASLLSATARYERTIAKLPTFTETTFEIDKIKLLDYRLSENIGVTLPVLKDDEQKLNLDFGTGYTREEYSNGREISTASSLLRASATQKLGEKAQFSQQVTMFSDLTNMESWRLQTDISLTMPITKNLALRVSGLNRFDNNPLNESVKRNDFSLLTGFKISF